VTDPPAVAALAAAFGLDPTGAEVLRAATRHVVRFPAAGALTFAVADGPARHEAAVATLLAEADVPATRLLAGPTAVDGWWVTAWREIPDAEPGPVDAAVLGTLAARLHRATRGGRHLRACDPLAAARAQLAVAVRAGRTGADDLDVLEGAARRLEPTWRDALADAGADGAVVHGDLHAGNVVVGRDGPVLVDLELAGWGPPAYDAAPTVAFVRWYGSPEGDATAFDAAYGAPITDAARARHLEEVWALWSTCWCVANRHRSAELEQEARIRIATVATGEAPERWQLR